METPQKEPAPPTGGTCPVDAGRLIYELSRKYGGFDEFELPERTGSRDLPDLRA